MFFKRSFFFGSVLVLSVTAIYFLSVIASPFFVLGNSLISSGSSLLESREEKTSSHNKNTPASSVEISAESSEVQTAAKGDAKGEIFQKTIGSQNANLKYNKIYVQNNTSKTVNLKTELLAGVKLKPENISEPTVLIVHTHTTECFMEEKRDYYTEKDKTRTTDNSKNIVEVGNVLKSQLEARGFGVIHATEKHDYPEYSGSYGRAEETIKKYLEKYPTVKVVIDLHRDSVTDSSGNKTALTVQVDGKSAAQLMIVAGCEDKSVENFPNWRENFRLAIKLQQSLEVMYPGLARPILFTARRYNQHLTTGSLLIECGTEANTLEEAKYSATLLASALSTTLKNLI